MNAELDRAQIRARFLAVDTSNVADILDELGYMDQGLDASFQRFPASAEKLAGFAYTIRGQMMPYAGPGDPEKMQACNGISPHEVSVWSGDGEGICYFGELIALGLKERGAVGALVDGGVRDVRWLAHHGFTVFARYRTPVQSIGRWKVTAWQTRVYVRGATARRVVIEPGDFILGDDDGAIVVPKNLIEPVLVQAEQLTRNEEQIRTDLTSGLSLGAALDKYGRV